MKRKVWNITVKDNPNRVVMGENDEFYTTDTEAFLVFNLQDKDFQPQSAMLTLENRNDGSLKSEEVSVVGDNITWEMPERYIEHSGNWQAQLVYEQMKGDVPEKYTSGVMSFTVNSHIKDKKKPSLVEIENWEKFIADGTELIETWQDMEDLRQANETQRQANYQELLDTGVLQTNINTKLEALEEEYAPRLTEVAAQLAQTDRLSVSVNYFREESDVDDTQAFKRAMLSSGHSNIEIPEGEYILSEKITIPYGKRLAGKSFRGNVRIVAAEGYEGVLIEVSDGGLLENVNVRGVDTYTKGVGIDIPSTSKWTRLRNVFVSYFDIGVKVRTYYHQFDGLIVHKNGVGIEVGYDGGYAGGTTITGSHIRDNDIGVKVLSQVNSLYLNGCVFEWNGTHIEADGEVDVRGAYLEDMCKSILSSTKKDADIAYIEQGAGRMISGGSFDEICYAVKHPNAHLVNGVYGVNAQFTAQGWKKGAVFGEGFYNFTNVKFAVEDVNIKSGCSFETSDKQMISRNSTNYPNYIKNGLFLDDSSILTDHPETSIVSGQLNPWGGKVVRFGSSTQSFTFDVPPEQVGKRHLLYIFLGKKERVVSTTYLSLSDLENIEFVENGINQTFGYTDDNPRTIGGEEDRLGFSVFEVIPTSTTGEVAHFGNILPDSNGFMDIAAVILTPIDETEKNYPIGWFNNGRCKLCGR